MRDTKDHDLFNVCAMQYTETWAFGVIHQVTDIPRQKLVLQGDGCLFFS